MIWSVSMLAAGSTTVPDVSVVTRSMAELQLARVGHPPAHRARRGRERARQQRARAGALAALEVAIARADRVLAPSDHIAVHAQAHGAAGFAPLGARIQEHAVETF